MTKGAISHLRDASELLWQIEVDHPHIGAIREHVAMAHDELTRKGNPMNADAITKQIMEEIVEAGDTGPSGFYFTENAMASVEYAISRAVGSIISGLSPVQTNGAPAVGCGLADGHKENHDFTRQLIGHDDHVPTDLRRELVQLAQDTGLSYYYFCGLYQRGLADGQAGIPVR